VVFMQLGSHRYMSQLRIVLWYLDGCVLICSCECVLCMQLSYDAVVVYSDNEVWLRYLDWCV
jgi:hypothetical protein